MRNVVHALVPEAQPRGTASGYGAARALMATIEHLEYAATSDDASLNMVAAVAQLAIHGESVHARLEVAVELAQHLLTARPTDWPDYCGQLQRELRVAMHGGEQSIGFDALHDELMAALKREREPAYAPAPRRYVLGLVRLPSGRWEYRLPRPGESARSSFGNYGY